MRFINIVTGYLLLSAFFVNGSERLNDVPPIASTTDNDVEVIEVFGNFNPILVNQMPSPFFVLSEQQLQAIAGTSALDILAHVPGINIKKSGAVQEIFLRGAETNFVIIQIDGVQVNNPLDSRGGGFDLTSIAKSAVQRVEVIKGAQSSIYGSDAVVGVINFITFEHAFDGSNVAVGVMPKGQKIASIKLGTGSVQYRANMVNTDVQKNGDKQKTIELAAQGSFEWVDNSDTRVNVRYNDYQQQAYADQSGGVVYAADSTKDEKQGRLFTSSIRHNQKVAEHYQVALQAEYYLADDTLVSAGVAPYLNAPPSESHNQYAYYKLRWLNGFQLDDILFTAGVDYKSEDGETSGHVTFFGSDMPTEYQIKRDNLGVFIDTKWSFEKLTLFYGVRHDETQDYNSQQTWKLGADYLVSKQLRLFANLGTAFKLPSLYALSNNMIGNSNLKPEQAKNQDVGIEWTMDPTYVSFSIFNYQYKDLIDFDGDVFLLVNRSNITSQGAEVIFNHQFSEQFSVQGDVTYVDLQTENGEVLTGRPQWQGGLGINYQFHDDLRTSAKLNYVGNSQATSLHTGEFTQSRLTAYRKMDITTTWLMSDQLTLDLYLQNVFDEHYHVAVGVPGNEVGLGLQIRWQLD